MLSKLEFDKLKFSLDSEYRKYRELSIKLSNIRDMIDGCLNRIAISDDEEEVLRYYNNLISFSIKDYKDHARITHNQWLVYKKLFDVYLLEKKNHD